MGTDRPHSHRVPGTETSGRRSTIVTVTPNPSLDRTFGVADLRRGHVLRATSTSLVPSGKGVNVSRVVAANGAPGVAVLPIGGHDGDFLVSQLLDDSGIRLEVVRIHGRIRSNITVLEPDGTATKLNEAGPTLSDDETRELADAAVAAAVGAAWLVGSGSLAPGMPDTFYAGLVARVAMLTRSANSESGRHRPSVAIDVTGSALAAAVGAGADLVKPNVGELAEVCGTSLSTVGAVASAAADLRRRGARAVLASMGADGALLATDDGVWFARADIATIVSAVGAGDTLLAGFLLGGGTATPADALATGVALAARRCVLDATEQPRIADTVAVTATMLSAQIAARALDEPAA